MLDDGRHEIISLVCVSTTDLSLSSLSFKKRSITILYKHCPPKAHDVYGGVPLERTHDINLRYLAIFLTYNDDERYSIHCVVSVEAQRK